MIEERTQTDKLMIFIKNYLQILEDSLYVSYIIYNTCKLQSKVLEKFVVGFFINQLIQLVCFCIKVCDLKLEKI